MTPRRGRPPKPVDEVRTVRVTVLLDDHEHATLLRACGGRGMATMLREAGLREAEATLEGLRERSASDAAQFLNQMNGNFLAPPQPVGVDAKAVKR
jgi:hypothetical protein